MAFKFDEQKVTGQKAEAWAMDYWLQQGYSVEDVRDDPLYRRIDVDLLVGKQGNRTSIEVKLDSYCNGNFFFFASKFAERDRHGYLEHEREDQESHRENPGGHAQLGHRWIILVNFA
jgi:hypothetical protein